VGAPRDEELEEVKEDVEERLDVETAGVMDAEEPPRP
jgi:hypothetical protein